MNELYNRLVIDSFKFNFQKDIYGFLMIQQRHKLGANMQGT